MRISTQTFYQRNTSSITERQANLSQLNLHLTEGKLVLHAADDPVAAASIQRLKQNVEVNTQYLKNIEVADTANIQEESSLQQVVNIMQRARELMVSAQNGTYNSENLNIIAQSLTQLKGELLSLANTKDGNNEFIFAGYEVDTKPFQVNEFGSVEYFGDQGTRSIQVGTGVKTEMNDSGFDIFMNQFNGNGSFVSETGISNNGSGIIEQGTVFEPALANEFIGEEYSIQFTLPSPSEPMQYSVYSVETPTATVNGSAKIAINVIDLNDINIANVLPSQVYPDALSEVNVDFLATATPGEFEVQINGQSSLPIIYDANIATTQQISIDGISIDVEGVPVATDQFKIHKYIAPTQYLENQSIEFNGVRTKVKGQPIDNDSFTLSPSTNTNLFATIQRSIDALLLPGNTDKADAVRQTQFNMSQLEFDAAFDTVIETRSKVGTRMQILASQKEIGQDFKLVAQSTMSTLEDLDMARAISDLNLEETALEVAQQTFIKLQRLSLFDLLR